VILDRFPDARAFALPTVIEQMRRGSTPDFLASFWKAIRAIINLDASLAAILLIAR
jgi:hypothetical protein